MMTNSNEYVYGNFLKSFLKWAGNQDIYLIREFEHFSGYGTTKGEISTNELNKLIKNYIKEKFSSDFINEDLTTIAKELEIAKETLRFYAEKKSYWPGGKGNNDECNGEVSETGKNWVSIGLRARNTLASLKRCPHCNKKESEK